MAEIQQLREREREGEKEREKGGESGKTIFCKVSDKMWIWLLLNFTIASKFATTTFVITVGRILTW